MTHRDSSSFSVVLRPSLDIFEAHSLPQSLNKHHGPTLSWLFQILTAFPRVLKGLRFSPGVSEAWSAWGLNGAHIVSLALIQTQDIPKGVRPSSLRSHWASLTSQHLKRI